MFLFRQGLSRLKGFLSFQNKISYPHLPINQCRQVKKCNYIIISDPLQRSSQVYFFYCLKVLSKCFVRSNYQVSYCFTIIGVISEITLKFVKNARSQLFGYLILKAKTTSQSISDLKLPLICSRLKLFLKLSVIWLVFVMEQLLKREVPFGLPHKYFPKKLFKLTIIFFGYTSLQKICFSCCGSL